MTMQGNLQQRGNKSGTRTSSGRESKSQTNVSIVRHYDSGKKYKKRKSSVNSRMERIIRVLFASLCIFILIIIVVGLYMQNHMDNERSKVDPNLVLRPDEMADVGDKSIHYRKLREAFDKMFPADTFQDRFGELTRKLRERQYKPTITPSEMGYDVFNCPDDPPENYPYEYNLLKLMDNWQPDDPEPRTEIFQGICVFNHATEYDKAMRYREAEVPFVIRDDPDLLRAAERWNQPEYLEKILGNVKHRAEYSPNNHFMYWVSPRKESRNKKKKNPVLENWKPPTENIHMKYIDWVSKANVTDLSLLGPDEPHWYFRLIGCGPGLGKNCDRANSEFVFDEIPIFQPWPHSTLYLPHPGQQRGIHCRFGMRGIIAENHFDGSRNMIAVLGGERRYILSHPKECENHALYPKGHPSSRHSEVDWSNPDLEKFPEFAKAKANEIVLQAGDVLYLPTQWFHYIISLGMNFQCNSRSGVSYEYSAHIKKCGF